MKRPLLFPFVLAVLVTWGCSPSSVRERWFLKLPVTEGMKEVVSGHAIINNLHARYFVYAGEGEGTPVRDTAEYLGWIEMPGGERQRTFITPLGVYTVWTYRRGNKSLLLAFPGEGTGFILAALLDEPMLWIGEDGETPGVEPADAPRPVESRRILYVKLESWFRHWEASWYLAGSPPETVMTEGVWRLSSGGWIMKMGGERLMVGWRPGKPQITVRVFDRDGGSCFSILAAGKEM